MGCMRGRSADHKELCLCGSVLTFPRLNMRCVRLHPFWALSPVSVHYNGRERQVWIGQTPRARHVDVHAVRWKGPSAAQQATVLQRLEGYGT